MKIVAVILTSNDAKHLQRCLSSLRGVADAALVVDSYSTDDTTSIAREYRARVVHRDFDDFATQFNWGLDQLKSDYDWVLRLDPDEYVTPQLATEIRRRLPHLDPSVHGVFAHRQLVFKGQPIRFGGNLPGRTLRLFRHQFGQCEQTHSDPQITVPGPTVEIDGDVIVENLGTLSWWIHKLNERASEQAADRMLAAYPPSDQEQGQASISYSTSGNASPSFPLGFGALCTFLYRYLLRGGFLDGGAGTVYHVLHSFWYRYLVAAKFAEAEAFMRNQRCGTKDAVLAVLNIDLRQHEDHEDHEDLVEHQEPAVEQQQIA